MSKYYRLKFLTLGWLVLAVSSCTVSRRQVASLTWMDLQPTVQKISYALPDSSLVVEYATWNEGGLLKATVSNYSDSTIYIDLNTSRLEVNGFSRPYNRPNWMYKEETFDMTAGKIDDYLTIDPRSVRTINLFELNAYLGLNYDMPLVGPKDSLVYGRENTTLNAVNHLVYAKGMEQWQGMDHPFYLSKVKGWVKLSRAKPLALKDQSHFYVTDEHVSSGAGFALLLAVVLIFISAGGF